MTPTTRTLARDEVRLEDGTVTKITAGDTWIEFEDHSGYQGRNDILNKYTIHDIVTDAIQVKTTDETGETHIGDYEISSFRENAEDGYLVPKSEAFPDNESPDAAALAEDIVEASNTHVDAEELMTEFDEKHNALQERAFSDVIKPLIIALATTPQTDRRNNHANQAAKEIIDTMDWEIPPERR